MRAVVQRVNSAAVDVQDHTVGAITAGLLVYLGVERSDSAEQATWMAQKIAGLRIFSDETDRMTLAATDVNAQVLVVSQFTLYGDVRRGRRPSFERAAPPPEAQLRYEETCQALASLGLTVATGQFRAHMLVTAQVDGPVTILIDSDKEF